jgi:hypothetical protein
MVLIWFAFREKPVLKIKRGTFGALSWDWVIATILETQAVRHASLLVAHIGYLFSFAMFAAPLLRFSCVLFAVFF